jgi:hypothetical protein
MGNRKVMTRYLTVRHFDEARAGRYTPRQSALRRGSLYQWASWTNGSKRIS